MNGEPIKQAKKTSLPRHDTVRDANTTFAGSVHDVRYAVTVQIAGKKYLKVIKVYDAPEKAIDRVEELGKQYPYAFVMRPVTASDIKVIDDDYWVLPETSETILRSFIKLITQKN